MKKGVRKSSGARKSRSSEAAGSFRGFSLQATRFLYHLMASDPPDVVCLEVLDDISIQKADGQRVIEQDKSYLSRNALSDKATAFWKTLRNWVESAKRGEVSPDRTRFILHAPGASPGTVAALLNEACDLGSVNKGLEAAEKLLDTAKSDTAEWCDHAKIVMAEKNGISRSIIQHFHIDVSTTSADALRSLFTAKLVSDDAADNVIAWSHGWVKTTVDALLNGGKVAQVVQSDFHSALLNYVKAHDRLVILRSYAGMPDSQDVSTELAFRCYVRQLRVIDMDDIDVLAAVNDYLRAAIDRTEWSNRGFIDESSLNVFESELVTMWRNKKNRNAILHADCGPAAQGQLLYADCIEHRLSLDGLTTPETFLRGSLHALAEDREVGWHPDYINELDRLQA
jgi:hypothetical protein